MKDSRLWKKWCVVTPSHDGELLEAGYTIECVRDEKKEKGCKLKVKNKKGEDVPAWQDYEGTYEYEGDKDQGFVCGRFVDDGHEHLVTGAWFADGKHGYMQGVIVSIDAAHLQGTEERLKAIGCELDDSGNLVTPAHFTGTWHAEN